MVHESNKRIEQEKHTVSVMIHLFCKQKHSVDTLCPDCRQLLDYAHARLDKCPHKHVKPTCSRCAIHCYSPQMRQHIRVVMRYAGPRMILHHPVMALRHLWREKIKSHN